MIKVIFILLIFPFISCTFRSNGSDQGKSPGIQDIVSQWTEIDLLFTANLAGTDNAVTFDETFADAIDVFCLSLEEFQKSELYRTYRAIPFSPQTVRGFGPLLPEDIQEVSFASDLALLFRDSVILGDVEKARAVSEEISGVLISLLIMDGDTQRHIGSSYFKLLIALIVFILIIALLVRFLHQSLVRSLKREANTMIFSHAYMLAQDEERGRISRELHDTVIQDLRYLLLETEKMGTTEEKNEREKLSAKTVPMMAALIRKTQSLCSDLIPPDFRFSELPDALRQLCLDLNEKTGIDCRSEIDNNIKLDFLTMEKRLQVFRIVQEALMNIEKHSGAKEVIVTMRQGHTGPGQKEAVFISIGDDGKGFTSPLDNNGQIISGIYETHIEKSHVGIISMKERAGILGGRLNIITEPGEGSLVCLEIPL